MNITLRICMICIAGTFTVPASFGQYYYKLFFEDQVFLGRGFSLLEEETDKYLFHSGVVYNNSNIESTIFYTSYGQNQVNVIKDFHQVDEWTVPNNMPIIFDSTSYYYVTYDTFLENKNPDSVGWNFGILDKMGNQKFIKKILIHPNQITNHQPLGLKFVKNNEIILWGYSIPKNIEDPTVKLPNTLWVRLKRDGTTVSGPNFFTPPTKKNVNFATDVAIDIDSNLVMIYESRDIPTKKIIFKITENDQIDTIAEVPYIYPILPKPAKMGVTRDGQFLMTRLVAQGKEEIEVLKVNRSSEITWKQSFDLLRGDYSIYVNHLNIKNLYVHKIIETKNGDVVICGVNAVQDDFYNADTNKKEYAGSSSCSFIARFSPGGQLLWRHFLINMDTVVNDLAIIVLRDVIESADGSLVFSGDYGLSDKPTKTVPFMMKVGPNGCFDDRCSHVDKYWTFPKGFLSAIDLVSPKESLTIYPNPGRDRVRIALPETILSSASLQYMVTDLKGQIHMQGTIEPNTPEIQTLFIPSGMYIISIMDAQGKLWHGKWVKE